MIRAKPPRGTDGTPNVPAAVATESLPGLSRKSSVTTVTSAAIPSASSTVSRLAASPARVRTALAQSSGEFVR